MQYIFEIIRTGKVVERTMTVAEMTASKRPNGTYRLREGVAQRRIDLEHAGFRMAAPKYPIFCEASGCHPSQVSENVDYMRKAGVPTDFTPDGRAVWRDRNHRKRGLKALNLFDKSGYYGG